MQDALTALVVGLVLLGFIALVVNRAGKRKTGGGGSPRIPPSDDASIGS